MDDAQAETIDPGPPPIKSKAGSRVSRIRRSSTKGASGVPLGMGAPTWSSGPSSLSRLAGTSRRSNPPSDFPNIRRRGGAAMRSKLITINYMQCF